MDDITLNTETLAGLLKQGAAEMRVTQKLLEKTTRERDVMLKFAKAVEILPALEKAAAVRFPSGMGFAEKALNLAKKSSAELEKLAFMADHLPDTMTDGAKVAESSFGTGESDMGRLTEAVLNL